MSNEEGKRNFEKLVRQVMNDEISAEKDEGIETLAHDIGTLYRALIAEGFDDPQAMHIMDVFLMRVL